MCPSNFFIITYGVAIGPVIEVYQNWGLEFYTSLCLSYTFHFFKNSNLLLSSFFYSSRLIPFHSFFLLPTGHPTFHFFSSSPSQVFFPCIIIQRRSPSPSILHIAVCFNTSHSYCEPISRTDFVVSKPPLQLRP